MSDSKTQHPVDALASIMRDAGLDVDEARVQAVRQFCDTDWQGITDALTKTQQAIDRLCAAGDEMAAWLDHHTAMMEAECFNMRRQRALTQKWHDAKNKLNR